MGSLGPCFYDIESTLVQNWLVPLTTYLWNEAYIWLHGSRLLTKTIPEKNTQVIWNEPGFETHVQSNKYWPFSIEFFWQEVKSLSITLECHVWETWSEQDVG